MSAVVTLAERVQQERTARGLSQEVLAVRARTSSSTVHRIESGYKPGLAILERIAEVLGMTVSELLAPGSANGGQASNGQRRRKEAVS